MYLYPESPQRSPDAPDLQILPLGGSAGGSSKRHAESRKETGSAKIQPRDTEKPKGFRENDQRRERSSVTQQQSSLRKSRCNTQA